jgi:hypothetical protein
MAPTSLSFLSTGPSAWPPPSSWHLHDQAGNRQIIARKTQRSASPPPPDLHRRALLFPSCACGCRVHGHDLGPLHRINITCWCVNSLWIDKLRLCFESPQRVRVRPFRWSGGDAPRWEPEVGACVVRGEDSDGTIAGRETIYVARYSTSTSTHQGFSFWKRHCINRFVRSFIYIIQKHTIIPKLL